MRRFIISLLLACAACATSQAEPSRPASAALHEYTGQYVLQDGRVLTVTEQRRTLAAQIEGREPVLLKASGPATFASRAGDLIVTFDQHNNGNVVAVSVEFAVTQAPLPLHRVQR